MKNFIVSIEAEFKDINQRVIELTEKKNKNSALYKLEELKSLFHTLFQIQRFYEFTDPAELVDHMIKVKNYLDILRETEKLVEDLI